MMESNATTACSLKDDLTDFIDTYARRIMLDSDMSQEEKVGYIYCMVYIENPYSLNSRAKLRVLRELVAEYEAKVRSHAQQEPVQHLS